MPAGHDADRGLVQFHGRGGENVCAASAEVRPQSVGEPLQPLILELMHCPAVEYGRVVPRKRGASYRRHSHLTAIDVEAVFAVVDQRPPTHLTCQWVRS